MELFLIELHNPSAAGKSTSGVLSASDNTLYYNEKAAITPNTYKQLFKCPSQCHRRLAILKISHIDDGCKKHTIWRAANTKGVTGIQDDSIGLPFDAIWELNATKEIKTNKVEVDVSKGNWLPFFLFHPNHAARIATWLGLLSVILAVISIMLSLFYNYL